MSTFKENINSAYEGDNRLRFMDQKYLPRWVVVLIDIFLAVLALLCTYLILSGTPIKFYNAISLLQQALITIGITTILFFVFKTYSGIIRHSTFTDILKLAMSLFLTAMVLLTINGIYVFVNDEKLFLTTSIVLYMLLCFTFLLLFRISVKEAYRFLKETSQSEKSQKRVAIYGIDDKSIAFANALLNESSSSFYLVGFLAEKVGSKNYKLLGKPVLPIYRSISEATQKLKAEGVMFLKDMHSSSEKQRISEALIKQGLEVLTVPSLNDWSAVETLEKEIKPIQIEDLLDREAIEINTDLIKNDLEGKTVLVTGGAGSIGSEIVRQIAVFNPELVVILDQSEYGLYQLEQELTEYCPTLKFVTELADISNMYRLSLLFERYPFEIIYHAAAYKHVPIIERNPHEAIYVNIMGTVNLSILASKNLVKKFVMVSTDKAVNPTNVMGASKRAAEMYVQALQEEESINTRFITTRFGNVLGSSGSVIPLFRKQIAAGGPVTVTHKDIFRYFMTIPEACQLVLQAGTMGHGGEIYVFDMGKPHRIYDLAERMIRLSGFEPNVDIGIEISGLRPGEKLYEELLNDAAQTQPTHHPKIMISKVPTANFATTKENIKEIILAATTDHDLKFIRLLKELVPEFKSENSQFEKLDMHVSYRNVNKTNNSLDK